MYATPSRRSTGLGWENWQVTRVAATRSLSAFTPVTHSVMLSNGWFRPRPDPAPTWPPPVHAGSYDHVEPVCERLDERGAYRRSSRAIYDSVPETERGHPTWQTELIKLHHQARRRLAS